MFGCIAQETTVRQKPSPTLHIRNLPWTLRFESGLMITMGYRLRTTRVILRSQTARRACPEVNERRNRGFILLV
jgi:hypothetical protein